MTAHGSSDMAVEAMRRGAFDFLTKPFDAARLRVTLSNAASRLQLDRRISELASLERDHFGKFIGKSLAMQAVYKTIRKVAATDALAAAGRKAAPDAIAREELTAAGLDLGGLYRRLDVPLVISVDKNAPFQTTMTAMDAAAQAGQYGDGDRNVHVSTIEQPIGVARRNLEQAQRRLYLSRTTDDKPCLR